MRRKITHTFFIHKTFGKYFSKTIHKQVINHEKLVPLKLLYVYNNIIRYETEYKRTSTCATDDIPSQLHIKAFIIPSTDPHLSEYVAPHWMSREWISGFTGSAGTAVVLMDKAGLWTDSRYFLHDMFGDPLKSIWKDRPSMPDAPAFIYDVKYAGKVVREKLPLFNAELKRKVFMPYSLSSLDEIAWTLNLRGSDVHCNPVIVSYLLITQDDDLFYLAGEGYPK